MEKLITVVIKGIDIMIFGFDSLILHHFTLLGRDKSMKHKEIDGIYSLGSSVSVVDSRHIYYLKSGTIVRLGAAGEVVDYFHVKLDGVQTPITFVERQLTNIFVTGESAERQRKAK